METGSHSTYHGSSQESEDSRKDRASTEYAELRQDASVDISTHFNTFRMAVQKLTDLKIAIPSQQAIRFMKSLSDTKFEATQHFTLQYTHH